MNRQYPSAVDYTLALQHPAAAFADRSLQTAVFTRGLLGPEGIAGSSAVVFRARIGDEDYAVRCYTRQDASTPERYAALDAYAAEAKLGAYVGEVAWFDDEVLVKGGRWPVLMMGWITGQPLHEYVGYLVDEGNLAALRTLAERWLTLVGDLQQASFAHGDLQHGNILVDTSGKLRLVDFDSVWIPSLRGQPAPTETGHPSYQPPAASAATRWGPYMDTFPGLVIYLALRALARAPELWDTFSNGDNLLFERRDFLTPGATEIWADLAGLADAEIDRLAARLRQFCAPGWIASAALQTAIETRDPAPRPAPALISVPAGLRKTAEPKWWEKTGANPVRPPAAPAGGFRPVPTYTPAAPPPPAVPVPPSMPVPPTGPAPPTAARPAGAPLPPPTRPVGVPPAPPTRPVGVPPAPPTRLVSPSVYRPERMTEQVLPPPPSTPYQSRVLPGPSFYGPVEATRPGTWWAQPSMPSVRRKPATSPMFLPRGAVNMASDTVVVPDELRLPRWRQRIRDFFLPRHRGAPKSRSGLSPPLSAIF
jgi:hypothetical protein